MLHALPHKLVDLLVIISLRLQIVTSRLGRSSRVHSRAGSVVSEACSASSDDIETIQWKRGNVLGKGAYGTVGL